MAPHPRIVLVRPRNPLNIGAVARAMANFGFDDLVVVDPHPPVWETARTSALAGETVLRSARCAPTLDEALAGCTRVAGTSAGQRRKLDREVIPPAALKRRAGRGKLAIVFGSEKTGLGNEELSYCQLLVRIPTLPAAPSMNLAQAVAVCCYEWTRGRVPASRKEAVAPADMLLRLLDIATPILDASGFLESDVRELNLRRLRRTLLNARLSPEDVALLTQAARKVEYIIGRWPDGADKTKKA
jgi:tRNA/rRNA methyltransferase